MNVFAIYLEGRIFCVVHIFLVIEGIVISFIKAIKRDFFFQECANLADKLIKVKSTLTLYLFCEVKNKFRKKQGIFSLQNKIQNQNTGTKSYFSPRCLFFQKVLLLRILFQFFGQTFLCTSSRWLRTDYSKTDYH